MLFDSEIIAERKIQEAIDEGVFDKVPGKGKPLHLDNTPLEIRILKNAGIPPDWIQLSKEIDQARAVCARRWTRIENEYPVRRAQAEAPSRSKSDPGAARRAFTEWHTRTRAAHLGALKQVNSDILKLNLIAPPVAGVQIPYRMAEETERFDAAFPALPEESHSG